MKKMTRCLLAGLLALCMLTGCARGLGDLLTRLGYGKAPLPEGAPPWEVTAPEALTFGKLEYTRPDMDALNAALDAACQAAAGEDVQQIMDLVYAYYEEYDWFYTCYSLADIHYCLDMTDGYWEAEYDFCLSQSTLVSAGLNDLYYALAASPCRRELDGEEYFGPDFLTAYDGENLWDDTYQAMADRETALLDEYYALTAEADRNSLRYYWKDAPELARVLVDMILVRQQMAAYWGYDSYADFAWDTSFYRDYTPQQMRGYLDGIRTRLVPLYAQLPASGAWEGADRRAGEEEVFQYLSQAANAMGGSIRKAFREMESRQMYDITPSPNKYPNSFEVYLTSYQIPFILLTPEGTEYDKLTFAHEFGHFCNDYESLGSMAGVDVLEVLSQGMEYLSLCYVEDENLARVKMADSLSTYVEQAAFGEFEFRVYDLPAEEVTIENLEAVFDQVARDYGFETYGYDPLDFTTIAHFYISPFYIPSYVVSNDAAMELYSLEQEQKGAGLKIYEQSLDTYESYFLAFLEEAGLSSPFEEGRLSQVAELFRNVLLG